ncbi:MAG TPA: nucleotide sugar dehydrogenase [Anaerolineae bacterium]|nr:nucleotide sugar dehydrogenase [Anaerolineae bacterium]
MTLADLRKNIEDRSAFLGVVGLGYVGLPVACKFAEAGFRVIGVDIKPERVSMINAGQNPIEGREPGLAELLWKVVKSGQFKATSEYETICDADVIMVSVETPVGEDHKPGFEALRAATASIGSNMKPGALVIIESTIAPGTTDGLVKPLLEEISGLQLNTGFFLGHCPERVMPGKLLKNIETMPRVCGGSTPETAETMLDLYRIIVEDVDLDPTDCLTAELVKTTENTYRDVNIAFANEVALICEAVGGDVWKVRDLVNKVPARLMLEPGVGVGGHCIPKDPWLLANAADEAQTPLRIIPTARAINEFMPSHVSALLKDALASIDKEISGARILVMGYAYLADSDDTRNSPSEVLVAYLQETGAEVLIHDPYVPEYQSDLWELATEIDAVVVMVRHSQYLDIELEKLKATMKTPVLVDGRNVFDDQQAEALGIVFRGIGQGKVFT